MPRAVADDVRVELSRSGQLAGHPALDLNAVDSKQTAQHALDEGISVFDHQDLVHVLDQLADLADRQRVLADAEDGVVVVGADVFTQVVVGQTAHQDARSCRDLEFVVGAVFGPAKEFGLLVR